MNSGLEKLLDGVIFELIPMKDALEKALDLPAGAPVSVTASPAKGMEATIELAESLAEHGYDAIPHLSARLTTNRTELKEHVRRLAAVGVRRALVVGGDTDTPGEFFDAGALLRALGEFDHPFTQLGVTGYPEGHPFLSEEVLLAALHQKQFYASSMTTQMCFDVDKIETWVRRRREAGIELPMVVGMPGAIDTVKLMTIGARIGVGASLKYLAKNRRSITKLMRPGHFTPDELVAGLGCLADDPVMNLVGLHLFTFNQIEGSLEWLNNMRSTL